MIKSNKIAVLTVTDERDYPNHFWKKPLEESCEKLVWIDLKELYSREGKEKTHKKLLTIFEKEKPDFLFMFDSLYYDLDIPSFFSELNLISPRTKTVFFSGDDDLKHNSVRYLGIYFDYLFVAHNDFKHIYKKDGLKNTLFIAQTKPKKMPPCEKIYDVSFAGTPKADRKELMEFLIDKKINVSLFGYNWDKYPKLKKVYKGVLSSEDYLKSIGQTKINICFSKNMFGVPNMKGRFLEIAVCGGFALVEYSPQLKELFKEGKEIVFFRNKEELIQQIEYYLKHDKKRKEIAKAAYSKIKKHFDFEKKVKNFVKENKNKIPKRKFPKLDYSILEINEKIMNLPKKIILKKLEDKSHVSFLKRKIIKSPFKEYLQTYSLNKTKKQVSCCDYFVSSKSLGDYIQFRYCPFGQGPKKDYRPLLNINQILVTKRFFIENYDLIKKAFDSDFVSFVNNSNTAFVSIPLVKIFKFRKNFFKHREFSKELGLFLFSFHRELNSKRKNYFSFFKYVFSFTKEALFGKSFLISQLLKKLKERKYFF